MRVLITGSSGGIGTAVAKRFLENGHIVFGIDLKPATVIHENYTHFVADIRKESEYPVIDDVEILFNNAGVQNSEDDIETNLKGTIKITEFYVHDNASLKSVLFNVSASAVSGQEFPIYTASKSGLLGYMRNLAIRLAPKRITCNAISMGGVYTAFNEPVLKDPKSWKKIMAVTPMKKWTDTDEVADWVEFLTLKNRSMSGQNLLIDNGEYQLRSTFVWPDRTDIIRMNAISLE